MKLLTHNFLSSRFLKGVDTGYPLILRAQQIERRDAPFDPEFVKNIMPKIDYPSLQGAACQINEGGNLPAELHQGWQEDESIIHELHRVLLCLEVVTGELQCPESGRVFAIKDGIPNMMCNEDECN